MYPELSSHRVLTMEFIGDAVGVTDLQGLKDAGMRWMMLIR
jgi:predicted unusual protein kinase regulating ubiquinone biosynthesis (AarF/ABC1/UbiB family)